MFMSIFRQRGQICQKECDTQWGTLCHWPLSGFFPLKRNGFCSQLQGNGFSEHFVNIEVLSKEQGLSKHLAYQNKSENGQ